MKKILNAAHDLLKHDLDFYKPANKNYKKYSQTQKPSPYGEGGQRPGGIC